ncbi:MAG: hypothetical protein V1925_05370 [Candidatus Omnitrophota bacterium]
MKKIPLLIKTFLIFFIFNGVSLAGIAQNSYPTTDFILNYAKKLYQRGDIKNARYEFKKLLLIDPGNVMARQYLKKMGVQALPEDTVYSQNLRLKKQNADLGSTLNKFKEEVTNKSGRIADLKQETEQKEEKLRVLDNLIGAKNEAVANLHQEIRLQRRRGELRLFVKERQLEAVLSNLEQLTVKINEYRERVDSLEKGIESLRQTTGAELEAKERQLQQRHDKIIELSQEFDMLWQRLMRVEEANKERQAGLEQLLGQSDSLRVSLREKENEAAALREKALEQKQKLEGQLSERERKIAEQNQKIAGQADIINELNKRSASLLEAQQQLALVTQQLTQSRNESLDKEGQIRQLKALLEETAAIPQQAGSEERMYEFRDLLEGQELEIAGLRSELKLQQEAADKRLIDMDLELSEKFNEIEELNLRLNESSLQLEQAEKDKFDKDLWIEQLNNAVQRLEEASGDQLAKYLEKLNSLEDALKVKEGELTELKKMLDSGN